MNYEALNYLRCPVTGNHLQIIITKKYSNANLPQGEIEEGYMTANNGIYYPIIGGIPRLLPESMMIYKDYFNELIPDYNQVLEVALNTHGSIIFSSAKRNKKIQETFGFEWGLLNRGNDIKIWNRSPELYKIQLEKEIDLVANQRFETALDAGCGHGRSVMLLADYSKIVFGVEVSAAVELGYKENMQFNCHFIQADVHHLPFEKNTFDLLYSSGVLHHNPSTHDALAKISEFVKSSGLLCIWLYHPYKNTVHWLMRNYRYITRNLHVKIVYSLNAVSITPIQWILSKLGKQKKKWTEITIEQLDMLTPKYRHEHTETEVQQWLEKANYSKIKITDSDNFGFAIVGTKL